MYIGLISDTHGTFDEPFMDFLQPVDEIWHAGDFGSLETAQRIAAFKPLKGVYGKGHPKQHPSNEEMEKQEF